MISSFTRARFCLAVVAFLELFSIQPVRAAQPPEPAVPLSLRAAIQIALKYSPAMAQVRSRVEAAAARKVQAYSALLPQLDFTERFTRTNSPLRAVSAKLNQARFSRADAEPDILNHPGPISNFTSALTLMLPVFNQGQGWIGLSQARLDQKALKMAAARTRQLVIARTVTAYAGIQLAQKRLEVTRQALGTARAHLKLVQSRFQSGLVVKSDLLRARVRLAELEQELLEARSQEEVARAVLNATLGVEIHRTFRLTDCLQTGPAVEDRLEQLTSTALEQRPDLRQARHQEAIAKKEVSKAKSAHLPSLHLLGSYEINSEHFSGSADNYTVGAMMRLNLFSGYNLQAKVMEARASWHQAQTRRQQLELAVAVETRRAFLEAQSSWRRIAVARSAVDQAAEALRIVRNRYNSGLVTIVSLLDAEVALHQARTNYFHSLHDYLVARVQLALATGALDESFH